MVTWKLPPQVATWIDQLSGLLHGRLAWRLLPLLTGVLFAQGRRTVASWLRAGGLGRDYKAFYYFLGSLGRQTEWVTCALLRRALALLPLADLLLFALDDTPTKRAGPLVEGAGLHHNPTPGPAGAQLLYGHVWVTLAWVVQHPLWGALGLPLRALLYIRQKDVVKLPSWEGVSFRTKLELAAELVAWLVRWLRFLGKPLWIVADGAYAKRPFLQSVLAAGVVVVSRLRKDAALFSVPPPKGQGPGRPRKYGRQALSLAKRAAHRHGWQRAVLVLYGKPVSKTYKTFLATYRPVGGLIRVVLVREARGWVAYFCTAAEASVEQILQAVADRSVIEQDFHDLKEVHGVGQQQVRHLWANVAVYHLNLWLHTLIELWAWDQPARKLRDRRSSPWDDPERRPSHADRRNALRRACIEQTFSATAGLAVLAPKSRALIRRLVKLVA
jgi:hypothetical protein